MRLMRLTQRGDTIVEVLIVIAVMASVLGGAYTFVNSNVKNNQQAQEHTRAVRLAESQLELLRVYVSSNSLPMGNFCLRDSAGVVQKHNIGGSLPGSPSYPAACKIADGAAVDRYSAGIKADGNSFTVYVKWLGPNGNNQQVSSAYKVYR